MCVKLAYLAFLAIFVVVFGTTTITFIPVATCVVAEKVQPTPLETTKRNSPKPDMNVHDKTQRYGDTGS